VLAGGIAHEFNNILAVVLAHVDLALLDAPESSEKRGAIADIREAAVRAADLSKQMLAFSGRTRVHAEAVDVSGVIRSMGALLATSAPKEVELVLDLAADLPPVVGDGLQIQQIVLNLVLNAVEGIGNSAGKIIVRTSACEASADAASSRSEERVLIEVSDNGRGMDEATRRRAFDPFFSTKLTGRGLGLAVVHGNVRAHGGSVVVDSRPNGGATLRVYLPIAARLRVVAPANDVPVEPSWRGSGLVLVVDDGKDMREAAGLVLERIGFQVCYAVDGDDAIATARRLSGQLVAVLLDLSMPQLDAPETLAELKRINPTLPVVVTSGYSDGSFDKRLLMAASGFVPKPFTLASLLRAMQRAVTRGEHTKRSR
jgi:CheY-like chemotaxis protein/two-component sensor histidine kinase